MQRVELLQEGVVGLLRALERYDVRHEAPFWAYAAFWVRQAMQQLVAELTRPAVLSDRALRQLARIKDAQQRALQESGRQPRRAELVARTGLTGDQVDSLLAVEASPGPSTSRSSPRAERRYPNPKRSEASPSSAPEARSRTRARSRTAEISPP
jgi:DNA-directed RNA polymerase sigma subunit (sigma70/sigma32)